jgi:hypothetical protein
MRLPRNAARVQSVISLFSALGLLWFSATNWREQALTS